MSRAPELNEVIRFCNSYTRMPTLLSQYQHHADDPAEWFELLGEEWSCCDNIGLYATDLRFIFHTAKPEQRALMMTDKERAALTALPEKITVYRGCYRVNMDGLSWTTNKQIAEKFPSYPRYNRAGDQPLLQTGIAERSQCVLKLCRGEDEIICPTVVVLNVEWLEVAQ